MLTLSCQVFLCPREFNLHWNLHTSGKYWVQCWIKFQLQCSFNIHWTEISLQNPFPFFQKSFFERLHWRKYSTHFVGMGVRYSKGKGGNNIDTTHCRVCMDIFWNHPTNTSYIIFKSNLSSTCWNHSQTIVNWPCGEADNMYTRHVVNWSKCEWLKIFNGCKKFNLQPNPRALWISYVDNTSEWLNYILYSNSKQKLWKYSSELVLLEIVATHWTLFFR